VKVIREFVSFDDSLTLVFGHVKTMTKFIREVIEADNS